MSTRSFDLNIEEVLENWQVEHAIREVIANALDEQLITHTKDIRIVKDPEGNWQIHDYGRGLRIEHFTLKENKEKLDAPPGVIGSFGVGLKDALATFHRRRVGVLIRSPFGTYRLKQETKHGFTDIVTLHVEYDDTPNDTQGTTFTLSGVSDTDMVSAKRLFLRFAREVVLDSNAYGQVLRRKQNPDPARVYILGVLASEEPNFLFSYNITSLTESMRKRLNRERLNVGRATYTERIKAILKNATSSAVQASLIGEIKARSLGGQADEMAWIEISQMALNLMHQQQKAVFFTEDELQRQPHLVDSAKSDGYHVQVVTEQEKAKLATQVSSGGPQVRTMEGYISEYNDSFRYSFVDPRQLADSEKRIWELTPRILAVVGLATRQLPKILISETMRITSDDTGGVYDTSIPALVIKRSRLASLPDYAGTLLHEALHVTSGAPDLTRQFEHALTANLGVAAARALTP